MPDAFERYVKAELTEHGLVMGWAIICTENGEPYFDKQGDHIPEDAMLEAAKDFMKSSRVASEMHTGEDRGNVPFLWPVTKDSGPKFGFDPEQRTGLLIGMEPDEDMLAKFKSGELKGFSIGGARIQDEIVEEAA